MVEQKPPFSPSAGMRCGILQRRIVVELTLGACFGVGAGLSVDWATQIFVFGCLSLVVVRDLSVFGGHGWCCCGAETSLFTSSFCILGNELFRPAAILWHSSLSPFCVDFGQVFVFVVFLGCPLITRHRGRHKGACPERTYRLLPLPLHSLRPPQPPHIFLRSYSLFVIVFVRGERAKQNWR